MTTPDWLAGLAARAASAEPQQGATAPVTPGRVLLADGDGLAYFCAGNDECDPGQARVNLVRQISAAQRASGSESVRLLLTGRGSHKGHRYALARVKPYQGQRSSGRHPKNWEYLRGLLETGGVPHPVLSTAVAEADDLFGRLGSELGWQNVVHYTQDKDMRMLPGWHLTWKTLRLTWVGTDTFEHVFDDKVYGRKWFWLQMLHGDTADNVPGLPKMTKPDGRQALCGEATAAKLLDGCTGEEEARAVVTGQYRAFYGDTWAVNMLEQAILLWMRRDPGSSALDVVRNGPLTDWPQPAVDEILHRIAEAQV